MPPRGVKSAKRKRQYEHIKESARKQGRSTKRAKEIAARTVNKQRRQAGQTKSSRKRPSAGGGRKRGNSAARKRSGGARKAGRTSRGSKKR